MINVIRNLQIQGAGIHILNQFMNKRNIPAHCVSIKQHNRVILSKSFEISQKKGAKLKSSIVHCGIQGVRECDPLSPWWWWCGPGAGCGPRVQLYTVTIEL